jgi:hypothetical protein
MDWNTDSSHGSYVMQFVVCGRKITLFHEFGTPVRVTS